eukprot:2410031-Pyramimonas_sp.AAC.1
MLRALEWVRCESGRRGETSARSERSYSNSCACCRLRSACVPNNRTPNCARVVTYSHVSNYLTHECSVALLRIMVAGERGGCTLTGDTASGERGQCNITGECVTSPGSVYR